MLVVIPINNHLVYWLLLYFPSNGLTKYKSNNQGKFVVGLIIKGIGMEL